jgi:hypothetical protein
MSKPQRLAFPIARGEPASATARITRSAGRNHEGRGDMDEVRELWSVRGPEHWSEGKDVELLLTQAQLQHFAAGLHSVAPEGTEMVLVAWVAPWRAGEQGVRVPV